MDIRDLLDRHMFCGNFPEKPQKTSMFIPISKMNREGENEPNDAVTILKRENLDIFRKFCEALEELEKRNDKVTQLEQDLANKEHENLRLKQKIVTLKYALRWKSNYNQKESR